MAAAPAHAGQPGMAPPDPHIVLAPFMDSSTEVSIRYARWEQAVVAGYLSKQSDPLVRDTEATQNKWRTALRLFQARLLAILSTPSRLDNLEPGHATSLGCVLAEAYSKSKILSCRIFDINSLPTEILLHILDFAALSSDANLRHARLALSWVCRRWRSIVVHQQYFWSAIEISEPPPFERTAEFLERAGSSRLQIRIADRSSNSPDICGPCNEESINMLMDVLAPKLGQVSYLLVVLSSWPPIISLIQRLSRVPQPLALMERVEIHRLTVDWGAPPQAWEGLEIPLATFLNKLPSLRVLSLNGIHSNLTGITCNLRLLDIRRTPSRYALTLRTFYDVLRHSPRLHTVHIYAVSSDIAVGLYPPTRLPRLRSLVLGDIQPDAMCAILDAMEAPGLVQLGLRFVPHLSQEYDAVFVALTGKFPLVRSFHVTNLPHIPSPLQHATTIIVRLLASMPAVQILHLLHVDNRFFNFLFTDTRSVSGDESSTSAVQSLLESEPPSPEWAFPKLSAMLIDFLNMEDFLELLDHRTAIGLPVKRVYPAHDWYTGHSAENPVTDLQRAQLASKVNVEIIPSARSRSWEEVAMWKEVDEADAQLED